MVIEDDELEEAWGMVCDGLPAPANLAEGDCGESTRVGTPGEYINEQLGREVFHTQVGRLSLINYLPLKSLSRLY